MELKECTRSSQVWVNEYLNDKCDNNKYSQYIEKEVLSKTNVEGKQHDKCIKKLLRLYHEISKYQETLLKYKK